MTGAASRPVNDRLQLRQLLQHLIGSRYRFAVDLVSALSLNHVDQLFRHVDVGGFHVTLIQQTGTVQPRVLSFGAPELSVS